MILIYNTDTNLTTLKVNEHLSFVGESKEEVHDMYHEYQLEIDPEYKKNYEIKSKKELIIRAFATKKFHLAWESCIGVYPEYPISWGNYWGISIDDKSYPVLNIWSENFIEAVKRFNIELLHGVIVNDLCIITENEIPSDWYLDKLFLRGISVAEEELLNKWYKENIV